MRFIIFICFILISCAENETLDTGPKNNSQADSQPLNDVNYFFYINETDNLSLEDFTNKIIKTKEFFVVHPRKERNNFYIQHEGLGGFISFSIAIAIDWASLVPITMGSFLSPSISLKISAYAPF